MLSVLWLLFQNISLVLAFDLPQVLFLTTIPANNEYIQHIEVTKPKEYEQIIIGNPELGFFSIATENIKVKDSTLEISFFPISYQHPLQIISLNKKSRTLLHQTHVPRPPFFAQLPQIGQKGMFSSPFILFTARIDIPGLNYNRHYCTFIMNRQGELLACLGPNALTELIPLVAPSQDGQTLFIASPNEKTAKTTLIKMNLVSGEQEELSFPISDFHPHHQMTLENENLIALHRQKTTLLPAIRFFKWSWPTFTFWRDSLIKIDTVSGDLKTLWRHPLSWDIFRFGIVRSGHNQHSFGQEVFEWTHINSFTRYRDGWAFSIRDQNTIYIENGDRRLSFHGRCRKKDLRYFCRQHALSYLTEEKSFLLFNNGFKDDFAKLVKINEESGIPMWEWQSPWLSPRRGSVLQTTHKSLLALFPERTPQSKSPFSSGYLAEVVLSDKSIRAQSFLPLKGLSQAFPVESLGGLTPFTDKL